MDVDKKEQRALLEASYFSQASWSPDGSAIALSWEKNGKDTINLLNSNGKEWKELASGRRSSWSPKLLASAIPAQ